MISKTIWHEVEGEKKMHFTGKVMNPREQIRQKYLNLFGSEKQQQPFVNGTGPLVHNPHLHDSS